MKHFKHRKGFLLVEAIFALCIAGAIIAPLYHTLASFIGRIVQVTHHITALYDAKHFIKKQLFNEQYLQSDKKTKSKNSETITTPGSNQQPMHYTHIPLEKGSVFYGNIYLEKVTVTYSWNELFSKKTDTLSHYVIIKKPTKDAS